MQGYLSVNYSDNYYLLSQRFPEVPRLTAAHYEAMSLFNQLASSQELALQMILQPGDIQLLNNHTCLHYRSAFVDWPVSLLPVLSTSDLTEGPDEQLTTPSASNPLSLQELPGAPCLLCKTFTASMLQCSVVELTC